MLPTETGQKPTKPATVGPKYTEKARGNTEKARNPTKTPLFLLLTEKSKRRSLNPNTKKSTANPQQCEIPSPTRLSPSPRFPCSPPLPLVSCRLTSVRDRPGLHLFRTGPPCPTPEAIS
jgi:hypothetical protein